VIFSNQRTIPTIMPRFVILEHAHPRGLHYDFMLEVGESLKTWELPEPPAIGRELPAKILPDHRLAYLNYEGPVSGDRGAVKPWDKGSYRLIEQTNESMIVDLAGDLLHGQADILAESDACDQWKFSFIAST
jgi:hypothetical protein